MPVFRALLLLLLVASALCFLAYVVSGQPIWRRRGLHLLRWAVFAGLAFFAVLAGQRVTELF